AAIGSGSDRMVLVPAPYRLRHGDGSEQWYEVSGRFHRDGHGDPVMITVLRHISRQQRLSHAVELIAGGEALEDVLLELLAGVDHHDPRRTAGISWWEGGQRRV